MKLKKQSNNKVAKIIIFSLIGFLIVLYGSSMFCFFDLGFVKNGIPPTELCFAIVMWHNFNTLFIPAAITNDPKWIVAGGLILWTGIVIFIIRIFNKK